MPMSNPRKSYIGCWWSLLLTIGILIVALMTSCKSVEYIELPVVHTDTVYQSKLVHDSIYQHDSITIREKGDSIWIERWHTKYVLQELHDTLIQHVCDSIPYPVEKRVEVPAKLSWWQQTRLYLANILLLTIFFLVIIKIVKFKL
jgi:hypothetical protein